MNGPGPEAGIPPEEAVEARPWRRARPPVRLLAIRLQALGDTVLTLPYLKALRRLLPDATLDFLTREEVADIPRAVKLFDRVFAIGGGRSGRRQLVSATALLPRLWARRYQVVFDLQRNRVSRFVRRALAAPAWSEFDRFSPRLAGERTRATLEAVGLGPLDVRLDLELRAGGPPLDALERAGWDGSSDIVVLNPGGAFPGRSWPLDSYVAFVTLWGERVSPTTRFAVLGLERLAPAAAHLRGRVGNRLLDLVGRTTPVEAFALLSRARLVVSEDSGLLHMAWVAGAPTVGVFGASPVYWTRPHGSHSAHVSACRRPSGACMHGRCLDGSPTCLEALDPRDVVERAVALLEVVAGRERRIDPEAP